MYGITQASTARVLLMKNSIMIVEYDVAHERTLGMVSTYIRPHRHNRDTICTSCIMLHGVGGAHTQ